MLGDFARLPAHTVPLILLRHAKAVPNSKLEAADDRRPLDDAGRAEAKALAELLAAFAPHARLISSPAARCVDTLRPYAELSGAQVRAEPSLHVHTSHPRTDPARPRPAALIAEAIAAGEPTIVCAHRENISVLQAAALAALGIAQPASDAAPGSALAGASWPPAAEAFPDLPKDWDDPLPTSGFWVLNLALPPPPAHHRPRPPSPAAHASRALTPASPPLPAWRRWFRARVRTRLHHRPLRTAGDPAGSAFACPPLATVLAPRPPRLLTPADSASSADRRHPGNHGLISPTALPPDLRRPLRPSRVLTDLHSSTLSIDPGQKSARFLPLKCPVSYAKAKNRSGSYAKLVATYEDDAGFVSRRQRGAPNWGHGRVGGSHGVVGHVGWPGCGIAIGVTGHRRPLARR